MRLYKKVLYAALFVGCMFVIAVSANRGKDWWWLAVVFAAPALGFFLNLIGYDSELPRPVKDGVALEVDLIVRSQGEIIDIKTITTYFSPERIKVFCTPYGIDPVEEAELRIKARVNEYLSDVLSRDRLATTNPFYTPSLKGTEDESSNES